jgi:ADP-heptose:LPS heptosyltransferase
MEPTRYALPLSLRGPSGLVSQTGDYFRDVSRGFHNKHGHILRETVPDSEAVWARWLSTQAAWTIDWHRALGALGRSWTSCDRTEITRRWVEVLLHLSQRGIAGTWHARFGRPVSLHFRSGLLENVVEVRVNRGNGALGPFTVKTESAARKGFSPVSAWLSHRPHVCWRGLVLPVFSVNDMSQLEGEQAPCSTTQPESITDEAWLWNLAQAAQLLDDHAPAYAKWVRRVVRHIVPLSTSSGRTLSSSDPRAPGVVRLSLDHDPATIAELLVHEASHAYFQLLEQTGPVDDGSDQQLYYSPFKQADRPVRVILLTYHAFANVVLLYRALLRSRAPVSKRHVLGEVNDTLRKLEPLEDALFTTRALTPAGAAVRSALKARLVEIAPRRQRLLMTNWDVREAEAPCVVLMNGGIGDHLLALPAIRALVHLYPGRLKIVAHRAIAELFLGALAAERIIGVQTYTLGNSLDHRFDVEAAVQKIGGADVFISLSTGRSESMRQLRRRLAPRVTVGFFDDFDIVGDRPKGTHSTDWYFDLVRMLSPGLRFSDFTAAPELPEGALSEARRILGRVSDRSKLLIVHNETAPEKMWPWERVAILMRQFLSAHPAYRIIVVGKDGNGARPLIADLSKVIVVHDLQLATAVALVSEGDLFCGIDSAMLHFADFFRIPGVGLFGPTSPAEFGFRLAPHRHLRARQAMDVPVQHVMDALETVAKNRKRYSDEVFVRRIGD